MIQEISLYAGNADALHSFEQNINELLLKVRRAYFCALGYLAEFLKQHGCKLCAFSLVTFLGEPCAAWKSNSQYLYGYSDPFQYYGMNPESISLEKAQKKAILLLHGNYHNQSAFLDLGYRLEANNLGPVYSLNLHHGALTEADRELIHAKMDKIRVQYSQHGRVPKIDIIGHSRGSQMAFLTGLGDESYHINASGEIEIQEENIRLHELVDKVVRIGMNTPLEIRNKVPREYLERVYEVHAIWDLIEKGSSLAEPDHQFNAQCGHVGLLYSRQVHDQIMEWIS